jgi:hypothetical protein
MTEFAQELRHYCRNDRTKLKEPVGNPRDAFCCRGCHSSFYRNRCIVCERPFKRRQENQRVCRKPRCRNAFKAGLVQSRYLASSSAKLASKTLDFIGSKVALKGDRPWRIVAGPPLTPNQLHCATVSDGSDCQWRGGDYERLEAKNRTALKAAEQAEIEANGEFTEPEWREVISPDGIRCFVTRFRDGGAPLSPLPADDTVKRSDWKPCSPSVPVADDLSIPDFLKRDKRDGILEAAE